ncbi:putative development/cell death domain, kelch-type beta propeller containing protein [Tanacetum coccineum]
MEAQWIGRAPSKVALQCLLQNLLQKLPWKLFELGSLSQGLVMGVGKQKSKFSLDWASKEAPVTSNFSVSARNFRKSDVGAVIFGLPGPHFQYIKNLSEGHALFLFNYHDRKLHGIFEAVGPGQMNIDRYAWVREGDNTGYTSFPAQGSDVNVQANIATDHTDFLQENTLEESQPVSATTYKVELIQTEESESSGHISDNNPDFNKSETNESDKDSSVSTTVAEPKISTDVPSWVLNLIDEVKSLKGSQLNQIVKINMLEKRLVESKQEVQQLKNRICSLEHGSQHVVDPVEVDDHESIKTQSNFDESVYIVGGFDGSSWSSSLESYSPFKDTKSSLNSMQFVKKYASAAVLNGELYHFGGEGFHTVESFIPSQNQWVPRPPLFWKNVHVAGASVKDRLFVVGGAKGRQCSSEVEYLDLDIRK